jgi:hypothetical protein
MPPPYSLPRRQRRTSIEALANTLAARLARTAPRGHQIQPAAQRLERRVSLVDFPARPLGHTQCDVAGRKNSPYSPATGTNPAAST